MAPFKKIKPVEDLMWNLIKIPFSSNSGKFDQVANCQKNTKKNIKQQTCTLSSYL